MTSRIALLLCFAALACGAPEEESDVLDVEPGTEQLEGKADVAAGNVEVKVTLPKTQVAKAVSLFKLTDAKASKRAVWFYDTPGLDLFESGLILRARKLKNAADDSTVKLRPMLAADVDRSWFELDGFKCEEDRTGTKSVQSCSLSTVQDKGEIDDAAAGERTLDRLFTADQEDFLSDFASVDVDWSALEPLGPVDARVWKFSVRGLKWKLTAERWLLPGGGDLLELSTKVTGAQADAAQNELVAYLKSKGFDTSARQETKTRVALETFSARR